MAGGNRDGEAGADAVPESAGRGPAKGIPWHRNLTAGAKGFRRTFPGQIANAVWDLNRPYASSEPDQNANDVGGQA